MLFTILVHKEQFYEHIDKCWIFHGVSDGLMSLCDFLVGWGFVGEDEEGVVDDLDGGCWGKSVYDGMVGLAIKGKHIGYDIIWRDKEIST